ncbi:MAG: hypothetical protein JNM22_05735 [Saprospiraceae bacterium]|nr:hypothetical protein [Saprospiraceae bacterium]
MDLIFKITAGSPNNPAQVGDTNFQQHYTGVNMNMAWDDLTPGIRQATQKFVIPYIGEALYNDLADMFQNDEALSAEQAQVLEYLQDCVAYYTIYHVLPERNSVLASMGVVTQNPQGGSQPVGQWSWKAKRWSALENGDSFLDTLLNYLEGLVSRETPITYFVQKWKDTDAYKVETSAFFRHTSDLNEYLNIQRSRRSFVSLVKYMRDVEEDVLLPLLCTEQFEALQAANLSADGMALLKKVRKVVANLGLVEALPHHRIVIDGDGFRVVSQTDQFDDRRNQTNNVHESAIIALGERAEKRGRQYLTELAAFLNANADLYPLWADSPCNAKSTTKGHSIVVSPDKIGGIGLF